MPLTLTQLRTPITRDQALQVILDQLQALGFNVTSWQSGSVQRTMLTAVAEVYRLQTEVVADLVDMAFNSTSTDEALTTFSDSHYDNQRVLDVATVGRFVFTGGATGPPHAISIGDMVVRDTATDKTYRNITAGTIPASGTVDLSMQAEEPGIASNIPNDSTLELVTVFAGATATNPLIAGSSTWITTQGVDEEADSTLQERNTTKWAVLNFALPELAYVNLALNADSDVTRVKVDDSNPRGPGTLDVYIARATGVALAADVVTVQAAIDQKRPVTADPVTIASTTVDVVVTGTIHVTTSLNNATKQAEIEQAVLDYVNGLDIGGEIIPPGTAGFLVESELVGAITAVLGVRRVKLTSPTDDVPVPGFEIAVVSGGAAIFTYVNID